MVRLRALPSRLKADAHFQPLKRRLLAIRIASAHTGIPMQFRFKTTRASPHRIQVFVDRIEQLFNSMGSIAISRQGFGRGRRGIYCQLGSGIPDKRSDLTSDSSKSTSSAWRCARVRADGHPQLLRLSHETKGFRAASSSQAGPDESVHRTGVFKRLSFDQSHARPPMAGNMVRLGSRKSYHRRWVAMWRPMEIFLYEWWPIRRSGRLYQKMSRMHVEVKKRAVEAS